MSSAGNVYLLFYFYKPVFWEIDCTNDALMFSLINKLSPRYL